MAKTQSMSIKDFMSGEWKQPKINKTIQDLKSFGVTAYSINGVVMIAMAENLVQGNGDTFENVWEAIMRAFDWGVVLVITFAGAAWALGHRSKAIEILIGVCCGYILARHAKDIRDFLRGI